MVLILDPEVWTLDALEGKARCLMVAPLRNRGVQTAERVVSAVNHVRRRDGKRDQHDPATALSEKDAQSRVKVVKYPGVDKVKVYLWGDHVTCTPLFSSIPNGSP